MPPAVAPASDHGFYLGYICPGCLCAVDILGVLHETGWVVGGPKGAAARLGMKRSTLQKKMKKLDISRPE